MKKNLVMALAASMVCSIAGTALAADPIELNGSFSVQYRDNERAGVDTHGTKETFLLNAKTALDKNIDLYARFAAQNVSNRVDGSLPDFNAGAYSADKKLVTSVDQFGVIVKDSNFSYKVGRQDATVGATALLYNNAGYLGKHMMVDGITAEGKSGITNLKVIAAKEDGIGGNDNKLYALQASYNPTQEWNLGAVLAKYDYDDAAVKDSNHWALNAAYTVGATSLFTEYTESNYDTNNKAYDLGLSYNFDSKNSGYIIAFRVEENGDINGWTDFDNNQKGVYYGFTHKFDQDTALTFFYKDNEFLTGKDKGKSNTSFRTTVTYNF